MNIEKVSDEFLNRAKEADELAARALLDRGLSIDDAELKYSPIAAVYWQEAYKALLGRE